MNKKWSHFNVNDAHNQAIPIAPYLKQPSLTSNRACYTNEILNYYAEHIS